MTWPAPRPGLVIRYSYLRRREARIGQEEGLKNRPCTIILAVEQADRTRVYALPITHAPPTNPDEAVELPPLVKARLGLDVERSWVVVTEANSFAWPGPDLRPQPGQGPESVDYGFLPPTLFRVIRDRFVTRARARRFTVILRSE